MKQVEDTAIWPGFSPSGSLFYVFHILVMLEEELYYHFTDSVFC